LAAQLQTALAGDFRILREIGRGGMAVVYEAEDLALERRIAMKFLLPDVAQENEVLERFRREAILASKLDHPSIVPIYNIGKAGEFWYISMKFIDGQTLKQYLPQKGRLEPTEALELLTPIAEAIDYAHENGIIHRDIKPSNILLTRANKVFLTDFGIAKAVDVRQFTTTGSIIGTPEYMCPEQADGKTCDYRSDIYSLGVVLYEMITGRPPFKGETPLATALMQTKEEVAFPRDVPDVIRRVLRRCLSKNPTRRQSSCSALISDFADAHKEWSELPRRQFVLRSKSDTEAETIRIAPREVFEESPAEAQPTQKPPGRFGDKASQILLAILLFTSLLALIIVSTEGPDGTKQSADTPRELSSPPRQTELSNPQVTDQPTWPKAHAKPGNQVTAGHSTPTSGPSAVTNPDDANLGDGLYLAISMSSSVGERWYAFVLPAEDAQYGVVDRSRDENGNEVLTLGGKPVTREDFPFNFLQYVVQHSVHRNIVLPKRIPFPQQGEFIVIAFRLNQQLTEENTSAKSDVLVSTFAFRKIDVSSNGAVANSDAMEIAGNARIVILNLTSADVNQ
jgi:serine/threonine protein kinase